MKVTRVLQAYELDRRPRSYALSNIKRITREDCRSFRNMQTNYFQRPRIMISGAVMIHLEQRLTGKVQQTMNQTLQICFVT